MKRLFLAAILSVAAMWAQAPAPDQAADQADPPSRVARLNFVSGDVAFEPAAMDTWTSATVNYPLSTGDHLFVNARGRAELHIGPNAIRLNSLTNFGFLNLSDSMVQMSLNEGSLELHVRQLDSDDDVEIDTPNGAVTLVYAGEYRIDTDPDRNATMVTVRSGQARMFQDGNTTLIGPQQTAYFPEAGSPELNAENPADDFDEFVLARDRVEDGLPLDTDVPETMVGYQDLYTYGRWVNDPIYGQVWIPPVGPGWSPYTTGRWAYVRPWGWTWVDDAPWGFAPFHYGRWVRLREVGWAWIPGAPGSRPVYAPALVGFIGGSGFGLSVGWFPLGPREPWIPGYGASRAYVAGVNFNMADAGRVNYVNRQDAVAVSQDDFGRGRAVAGAEIRLSPAQLQSAQVLRAGPQVAPGRGNVAFGMARPAPSVSVRPVIARVPPPAIAASRMPVRAVGSSRENRMSSRPPGAGASETRPSQRAEPGAAGPEPRTTGPVPRTTGQRAAGKQTRSSKTRKDDQR